MDPAVVSILTGVIANGLSGVIGLGSRGARAAFMPPAPSKAVARAVQRAVDILLAERPLAVLNDPSVLEFLAAPEMTRALEQLFVADLGGLDHSSAQFDFLETTALWTRGALAKEDAKALLDFLTHLVHVVLEQAVEENVLAAHEALDAFRFRVLLSELEATNHSIAALEHDSFDLQEVLLFEQDFRRHVALSTAYLKPPYLDSVKMVKIDDLYVPPNIGRAGTDNPGRPKLSVDGFLGASYRAVVLGVPGGGKSTLVQKICHQLASPSADGTVSPTPVLVSLREYGVRRQESQCSLKDFLTEQSHVRYQLDPPDYAFDYLLSHGRLIVLLDGLDELVDTADRLQITECVEHFCSQYSGLPVVVTSRKVGYDQAPLNASVFERYELAEFSLEQATEYARKWFSVDGSLTAREQDNLTSAFMSECESLPDLRSNALMLGLLCNIYKGENWIPRNRPDVYQKCALLLFERWDQRRGIHAFNAFKAHLRPALEYLAHWIFDDVGRQNGVSESNLIDAAARYLHERRFEDEVEATNAAREFIEFCRGRAWVFTDTGTAAGGERLYQFTHRTFLEYFTAVHLVRTHPSPARLSELLIPHILESEWEMVSQLSVHIQDGQIDFAGDTVLNEVLELVEGEAHPRALAALGFCARALDGIVPKPTSARAIATQCTRVIVRMGAARLAEGLGPAELEDEDRGLELEPLAALLRSSPENWDPIEAAIFEAVDAALGGSDNHARVAAAELGANLMMALDHAHRAVGDDARRWRSASDRFVQSEERRLRELAKESAGVAADLFWARRLTLDEFLIGRSLQSALLDRRFACFPRVERISLGYFLFGCAIGRSFGREWDRTDVEAALSTLGRAMEAAPLPWMSLDGVDPWIVRRHQDMLGGEDGFVSPAEDALFGLFGLLAIAVENDEGNHGRTSNLAEDLLNGIPRGDGWITLRAVLAARAGVSDLPDECIPADGIGVHMMRQWALREISICA